MKPVIICVDDEPIVLRSLEVELSEYFGEDYFLEFAETGEEALDIVDELLDDGVEIPVIIVDYIMPRLKGDDVLVAVHEKSPNTKTILLTGQANLQGITNAINQAELYRYISKPWDKNDLALTIKEASKVYYQTKLVHQQNNELKNLNAHLEDKVQERTQELEAQKEEAANALERLKETQSQLIQSERMASLWQLTAGVAHELNNPLNFVQVGTEALVEDLSTLSNLLDLYSKLDRGEVDQLDQFIQQIKHSKEEIAYEETIEDLQTLLNSIRVGARRSAEIVKGLRIFSGLGQKDTSLIDLNSNIDLTLLMLEHRYQERIQIHKNYTTLPQIECYAGQINQLLLNILTNAIESITDRGEIYIGTNELHLNEQKYVQIKIKDTGKGMSQAIKDKVFEPFFTTKEVGQGTGLGLSIAYGIIDMHHGQITVGSQENKGTEVCISLPIQITKTAESR